MKKIAIVSTMNLPTPAVKGGAVETLITHLIDENETKHLFDIDLYTLYDERIDIKKYKYTKIIEIKTNKLCAFIQKFINIFNIILKRKKYNYLFSKLGRIISQNNYDKIVVENNMFVYMSVYKSLKNKKNIPLIYHMHNDFNSTDKTTDNYKFIANSAEKILTVSNYIKKRVSGVLNNNNIYVLYNSIDNKLYVPDKAISLREKYNFKNEDIIIGYTGRITPEKGILELVKAFKKIITKKSIKLLIVGSQWYGKLEKDKYFDNLNNEIQSIQGDVLFTGLISQNDMPNVYKTMDILVVPSMCEEAFGCVAIEGMAMEKPIIVAKSGGLTEIVKSNFGYIIEKNEKFIDELSKKMELLVNDDEKRIEYGKNAKLEFDNIENYHKDKYYDNFSDYILK